MSKPTQDHLYGELDLTKRWNQHLRQTTKTTPNYTCPLCDDRPAHHTESELWKHIRKFHKDRVPAEEDAEALAKFEQYIKFQMTQPRYDLPFQALRQHDGVWEPLLTFARRRGNPRSNTSPGLSRPGVLIQNPKVDIGSRPGPQTDPTALTQTRLEALQKIQSDANGKAENRTDNKTAYPDPSYSPRKKHAVGRGSSPTSSPRSDISEDLPRRSNVSPNSLQALSARGPGSPFPLPQSTNTVPNSIRPSAPNKRLFDPNDPPAFQSIQASNTSRPFQHQRNRRSQPNVSQPAQSSPPIIQKRLSGIEPGTIPIAALQTKPQIKSENQIRPTTPLQLAESSKIIGQPETRPITQEQLVAEVKGIYAGLVMVEGKCIQVDLKQANLAREAPPGTQPKLNNEQWQALIALHRTLLHEHHDFFLASQHPSATPAVRRLAVKYAMPARLWRHGIHSFLELLRNRLPGSLDHMLAFIYLAYSMMTLLYETVPAFEETWIECLGDLSRYRMAIEDDNIRDREVWTQVARQWYLKAANRSTTTGRLYHHLAILARPDALPQLLYYGKALAVANPFVAAKDSIMTLFEPALSSKQPRRRLSPAVAAFIKSHAILFTKTHLDNLDETIALFIGLLDNHIGRVTEKFLEQGYYIAIAICVALQEFGSQESRLVKDVKASSETSAREVVMGEASVDLTPATVVFEGAVRLSNQTFEVALSRVGDPNVLSLIHCMLVFTLFMSQHPAAMRRIASDIPWRSLVSMLNSLIRFYKAYDRIEQDVFPWDKRADPRPFPEEWAMRGMFWTEDYWPSAYFDPNIEAETHYMEQKSMKGDRTERILWLSWRLAKLCQCIVYDSSRHRFHLPGEEVSDTEIESIAESTIVMADSDFDAPDSTASTWNSNKVDSEMTEDTAWELTEADTGSEMDLVEGSIITEVAVDQEKTGDG